MDIELLKIKFHSLIDEIENERLLEHFYELMNNLQKSREKQKLLLDEINNYNRFEYMN